MSPILLIEQLAMFVIASAIAMRPEAAPSNSANGARSPIAIASPS